jgi:hypothetical protein
MNPPRCFAEIPLPPAGASMRRRGVCRGLMPAALLTIVAALPGTSLVAEIVESVPPSRLPAERHDVVSETPMPVVTYVAEPDGFDSVQRIDQPLPVPFPPSSQGNETMPGSPAEDESISAPYDDGLKPIRSVTLDTRPPAGEMPDNAAAARFAQWGVMPQPAGTNRPWPLYCYWWEAPAMCHRPLYFEQVNLERYGYSWGPAQPLLSAAHFFGTVPVLPYLMGAEPCHECIYTLGHYRPGSYVPYHIYRPPLSLKGAAVEAAVVTGLIIAIP